MRKKKQEQWEEKKVLSRALAQLMKAGLKRMAFSVQFLKIILFDDFIMMVGSLKWLLKMIVKVRLKCFLTKRQKKTRTMRRRRRKKSFLELSSTAMNSWFWPCSCSIMLMSSSRTPTPWICDWRLLDRSLHLHLAQDEVEGADSFAGLCCMYYLCSI